MHRPQLFFGLEPDAEGQGEIRTKKPYFHKFISEKVIIFHQNVDRLANKIERLNHCLSLTRPDIVVITEHGLDQSKILTARLVDYNLTATFCRKDHQKGGVAIYSHISLGNNIKGLNTEPYCSELICEMAGIRMALKGGKHLYMLGIYRPPGAPLEESLGRISSMLETIPSDNSPICLVGDLNVDSLSTTKKNELYALKYLLASFNIHRINLPPTRVTNTSKSSIDVVCSNLCPTKLKVEVVHEHISDHTGQLTTLNLPVKEKLQLTSTRRHLSNRNLSQLRDLLMETTWDTVIQTVDVNEAYSRLMCILTSALDAACPYKTSRSKQSGQKPIQYSPEVYLLKTEFINAQNRFILSGREDDKLEAVQKKKAYDLKLKTIRREVSEEQISRSSNKIRAMWSVVNAERKACEEVKDSTWKLKISERVIEDPITVTESFNKYYTTIAEDTLCANNPQKTTQVVGQFYNSEQELITFSPATTDEVRCIIGALKPTSSSGVDDISAKLLKFCREELCFPLTDVINKSLTQAIFPTNLKIAKVYPLFKKGNKDDMGNFRPISLLPTFAKILEKVVLSRLKNHLITNNITPKGQHGFLPGRSTITAIAEIVEHILDNLEAGNTVGGTFLDLSKAFDCLDHGLILTKLEAFGIGGSAHEWFRNYLTGRQQLVEIKNTIRGRTSTVRSGLRNVTRGVPQGSVLGPVLFALFAADFPYYMDAYSHTVMFADDSVLLTSCKALETLEINNFISINKAMEYCANNDMVFNENKTQQLFFGRLRDEVSCPPNIQISESTKHLGVILDNNLCWDLHINSLCQKLSSSIFAMRRINIVTTAAATRAAYHALVESHLRYGIIFWGGSSKDNIQRVFVQQKRAMRILGGLQEQDSCRGVFKTLKVPTVVSIYICEVIAFASNQALPRNRNVHVHNTRNATDFNLPVHRTTRYSKKPSYAGAKLYNFLPANIKSGSPKTFKRRLHNWLVEDPIYSLEEFVARCQRRLTP